MTSFRWTICVMLFIATMINYLDRQVLSLTYEEFIKPEFHWTDEHYGNITAIFSFVYAFGMLFAGRIVDALGSKRGFLWMIGIWSVGACMHAFCGIFTQMWAGLGSTQEMIEATGTVSMTIATVGMYSFLIARSILALGESGNFPAAIKIVSEYFPKRDRAYATSIFNAGASIGALASPLLIPVIAKHFGWEMAFVIIGGLGFVWMAFWVFLYDKPEESSRVNKEELAYINQDNEEEGTPAAESADTGIKLSFLQCFSYRQTWAFLLGKLLTDGVWWFFLFWTPSYLQAQFGIRTSSWEGMGLIFTLYAITMLSILGGKLPSIIMSRSKQDPYAARMKAMLLFAFVPLVVLLAQPMGLISPWLPIILIGLGCAAHQSWSANIFSVVGDMFPKSAIATITGIGGMAGGIGSMLMQKSAGSLFEHADAVQMTFLGFTGKPAGYFIIFCVCSFSYLVAWLVMKSLVPRLKMIR